MSGPRPPRSPSSAYLDGVGLPTLDALAPQDPPARDSQPRMAASLPPTGARVLLVEADDHAASVVSRVLGASGHTSIHAKANGHALELLQRTEFDLLVCPLDVPLLDGPRIVMAARARDPDIGVVALAGRSGFEAASYVVSTGVASYVRKPCTAEEIDLAATATLRARRYALVRRETTRAKPTPQPFAAALDRGELDRRLTCALDSLWVAYQPIVDVQLRSVMGYEALLRSNEPTLPHPGAVLDAAERLDRLLDVGRAVRQRVLERALRSPPSTNFFVNLHAADLLDERLYDPERGLAAIAPRVVLEMTERASLETVPDALDRVAALRGLGFRVAIDDLGAGYAALHWFAQLEPDVVKLDMSLIRNLQESAVRKRIALSLVGLARQLGIRVVAEGVETIEERDLLVALGCDYLQGFLLGRPAETLLPAAW
jgi:EAL domain-containing protein (putative c-di-GMP-specific phosphodiesterase class I)/ActR/RegA family two-component response regulator